MVTVSQKMAGLERMLGYRGVGLERFHCILEWCFLLCELVVLCITYEICVFIALLVYSPPPSIQLSTTQELVLLELPLVLLCSSC